MKKPFLAGLFFAAAVGLQAAVQVGDTYATVVAEKGKPLGKMEAGGVMLLHYADQTLKIKDGRVIALEIAKVSTVPGPTAAPATATQSVPTAVRAAGPVLSPANWSTDYAAALVQAKEKNRHVFLFFTGSDWCGWCKRLNREILSTPDFVKFAGENLLLVELDFPRAKQLPSAVVAQNKQLAKRFQIQGYPTVIVLNSDGKPVGQLGYQEGGPGPFIDQLRQM